MSHQRIEPFLAKWEGPLGGEVFALPVLHGKIEFAQMARAAFDRVSPTRIALELPDTLGAAYLRAAARLPKITILTYETEDEPAYLIVEPADPFAEAARHALAAGLPVDFVDVDVDEPPAVFDYAPDAYAMLKVGMEAFVRLMLERRPGPEGSDLLRERGMAANLARLAVRGERVLFLAGLHHFERVGRFLPGPHAEVLRRVRPRSPALFHLSPESMGEALSEIPFVQAVYDRLREGGPTEPVPSGASMRRKVGPLELFTRRSPPDPELALNEAVTRAASRNGANAAHFDRLRAHFHLLTEAGRHYSQETGERFEGWQRRTLLKFLRNWALIEGRVLPDLFQLVEAAKGVVDSNYAYAVWRLATHYPAQGGEPELPIATITADMLGFSTRRVRMRRRVVRPKARPVRVGRGRAKGIDPSRWIDGFTGAGVCSYPPEDVAVESFGKWLKGKAKSLVSEEAARSEPFRGALLDGIDLRETIRHLPSGEIYVRKFGKVAGGMGSVVVIFDEDRELERHPYRMTWLGEHDQESDMAFYSTEPLGNVVGPGICRVEYGGFLLSFPPRRLYDVWSDPDYAWARAPADLLLAAAIDYSQEVNVVYCAAKPPRAAMRQYAARLGRRIVFVPSSTLGPRALGKMRVMHLLDGKELRGIAGDYVW